MSTAAEHLVFVSSTFLDNEERRKVVQDAIIRSELVPVGMERFTASSRPTMDELEEQVRRCSLFVGIVAHRYGWIPPGQPEDEERSITELEYDTAKAQGIPCLMFVIDDSVDVNPGRDFDSGPDRWQRQEKLEAFKRKISADQMPARFRGDDLGTLVMQALSEERLRREKARARAQAHERSASPSPGSSDDASASSGLADDRALIDELARVFYDPDQAKLLATRAGFPRSQLPAFSTSIVFWTKVVDGAVNGVLSGVGPIVEQAARMYPANSTFARYRTP